ncbi:hypothetical protein L6452_33527 [Arctium lappa]|uniref:Uncharacterized protein n=1 Tax=Arctium lappa TaxID=4217 RepID=A0ACB8YFQ0_ARCLA|nr:hypothetical protein L6452_33527 [Arctium lappa]
MSLLTLTIYPNFLVTNNHKWRTRYANIGSHDRSSRLTNNKTSWSATSNGAAPLTKLIVPSCTLLNERSDYHVTRETDEATLELEKKRNLGFWLREWDSIDITNLCWFTGIHVLGASAPFMFDWGALWTAVGLAFMTGFGVTLGYHRLLSHRSFKIPRWLEYFFVYCGVHALQRDPIFWVSIHKNHHMHADTDRDPHTPTQGFWFSHMGWFFYNNYIASKCGESRSGEYTNVPELKAQWFYRFLQDTYFCHPIALATLLYLYGGLPYLAWGMGMRAVMVLHITFLVGSVNHLWGDRPWNTSDTSTNHWFSGLLALGDGWHNNHHAFPKSVQHGLEWWQLDLTWELIKFLEMVGVATDVKLPTEADKKKMALLCTNKTKKLTLGLDHDI